MYGGRTGRKSFYDAMIGCARDPQSKRLLLVTENREARAVMDGAGEGGAAVRADHGAARTGGRILADALVRNGVERAFCVPGESYLALLDALYDSPIAVTVCRQEGGAAMAAEAWGKLTGRP